MKRRLASLLALVVATSACAGWATTHAGETTGTLVVSSERIDAPEGSRAWRVEYASQTIDGTPTTVTGWIAIPEVSGAIPVLAWGHPTVGLGDECAPSLWGQRMPFDFAPELAAGWAVVATDYEGLGGPGLHPYLVSESEARSIFDIARAARELDRRVGTRLMLWGFSQGGHAVLSAAALAPDLAQEFTVVGVVAVAPAVDLVGWAATALGTFEQGYIVAIVAGFSAAYGLDLGDVLTPNAIGLLPEVETSCIDPTMYGVAGLSSSGAFVVDPSQTDPWASLLVDNSPEFRHVDSPTLLVLGGQDDLWSSELAPRIIRRMCAAATAVATSIYPGETHLSVSGAARGEIHTFLADRLANRDFVGDC